jgi:Tfp pilus tip-associated adhesin PilY1
VLWSAGAHSAAVQMFSGMDAAFFGSLSAVDLDADGLHDRIYAGDIAGRVWRLDLHHGAAAGQWASGGIFADFSNQEGRGFLAAPDVSLSAPPGAAPWLNIAIGTAAPGNAAANNRFYALRDHAAYASWTDEDYEDWQPLREDDLTKVDGTVQAAAETANFMEPDSPGWYVALGSGHVVTPSLTVNHRVVLSIAAHLPRGGSCEVLTRIASVELEHGRLVPASGTQAGWRTVLPKPVALAATFTLATPEGSSSPCTLGGQRVAACDVDTRPRKTWWRRGDAE